MVSMLRLLQRNHEKPLLRIHEGVFETKAQINFRYLISLHPVSQNQVTIYGFNATVTTA